MKTDKIFTSSNGKVWGVPSEVARVRRHEQVRRATYVRQLAMRVLRDRHQSEYDEIQERTRKVVDRELDPLPAGDCPDCPGALAGMSGHKPGCVYGDDYTYLRDTKRSEKTHQAAERAARK